MKSTKHKLLIAMVCLLIAFTLGMTLLIFIVLKENSVTNFTFQQVNDLANQNKIIFCYSSHCRYCQKIFPMLFFKNFIHHNIIFVNLYNNYSLAHKLGIQQVPVIFSKQFYYQGNSIHKILTLIN